MCDSSSDELQFVKLTCGETYPLPLSLQKEGAAVQFLTKNGNTLQIILPGMNAKEQTALRSGMIKSGLLYSNGAMLFFVSVLWRQWQAFINF